MARELAEVTVPDYATGHSADGLLHLNAVNEPDTPLVHRRLGGLCTVQQVAGAGSPLTFQVSRTLARDRGLD